MNIPLFPQHLQTGLLNQQNFISLETQIQTLDEEFTALDAAEEELQSLLRTLQRDEDILAQTLNIAQGKVDPNKQVDAEQRLEDILLGNEDDDDSSVD